MNDSLREDELCKFLESLRDVEAYCDGEMFLSEETTDEIVKYFAKAKAEWERESEKRITERYEKELSMWKQTAELFMQREQLKLPEYIFCSGCGKKIMDGKPIKLSTKQGEE
jgi:hypothetical protein